MQQPRRRQPSRARAGTSRPYITAAVGLEETAGRVRARRSSLFTRTVIWVTGLICLAFLLGSVAQAWSNSQLAQQVQAAQQQTQQVQAYHDHLQQVAKHYQDPFVIEKEAREKLGYIRRGEQPVVVVSSGNSNGQPAVHAAGPPPPQGFWQAWWNVFFGGN